MIQAFLGTPLPSSTRYAPAKQNKSPRRRTRVCTLHAQSLESYREGNRFRNTSGPGRFSGEGSFPEIPKKEQKPAKIKLRVPLTKAMSKLNVASMETCAFLVRSGCVHVNGLLVRDEKARIHRFEDIISVNGAHYGPVDTVPSETESLSRDSDFADNIDPSILPRSQRDFPQSMDFGKPSNPKKNRRNTRRTDRA